MIFFEKTEIPSADPANPPAIRNPVLPFMTGPFEGSAAVVDRDEDAAPFAFQTTSPPIAITAADAGDAVVFVNCEDPALITFGWTGAKPVTRVGVDYPDVSPSLAGAGAAAKGWFAILPAGGVLTLTATAEVQVNRISVGNAIGKLTDWPASKGILALDHRRTKTETGLVHTRRNANARLQVDLAFSNHSQQSDADLMRALSDLNDEFNVIPLSRGVARGSEWQRGDVCRLVNITAFDGFQGHAGIAGLGASGRIRFNEAPARKTNIVIVPLAPAVPAGLSLTPGNTQIAVDWTDTSGAATYDVQHDTAVDFSSATTIEEVAVSDTVISGLPPETVHYVRVRAVNAGGTSDYTDAATTTTLGVPNVPQNVVLTPDGDSILVDWDDDPLGDTYEVRFAETEPGLAAAAPVTGLLVSEYTIAGLGGGVTRFVQVRANGQDGPSDWSPAASTTTLVIPTVPQNVVLTPAAKSILVNWDDGAAGSTFEVRFAATAGGLATATPVTGLAASQYTITGLNVGETRFVQVRTVIAAVPSPYTVAQSAKTVASFSGTPLPASDFAFDAAHTSLGGMWADGTTMWLVDTPAMKNFAYTLATGARDASKEFNHSTTNTGSFGLWSDGTTMWIGEIVNTLVRGYTLATGVADATRDFDLDAAHTQPRGMWSDGTTMWIVDFEDNILYAYTLATGARDATKDITLVVENDFPTGIWSDGTTIWVADILDTFIYAYTLATGVRDVSKEFDLPVDNANPFGLWSDGETLYISDVVDLKVYAYT